MGCGNGAADADARDAHRLGWRGAERVRLMLMLVMRIAWAGGAADVHDANRFAWRAAERVRLMTYDAHRLGW